jgi:membrane-associated phospholipid phosphatase
MLLALHLLIIVLAWTPPVIGAAAQRMKPHGRGRVRTLLDWLPIVLVPALYAELAPLNIAVHGGTYFDDIIIRWEQALFAGLPSRDWAAALPSLPLSELLHAAYLSYYFIIFVPPLLLFLRGRTVEFRATVFTVMLAFFVHYVFFIYFPVQGPRYLFAPPGGQLANGTFYTLTHRVLEAGSSQGAAFPSSHVGVSVAQTLITFVYMPRFAVLLAALTAGLALGAVYGGFHYAIDALAGLLLGAAAFIAAPRVARLLAAGTDRQP